MNVMVTGGTGFIGRRIVEQLIHAGHRARVLVRPNSAHGSAHLPQAAERVNGDILDSDLEKHLEGVDAVLHLVGIIREFPSKGITFHALHTRATANLVRAMVAAGVERLVHMSALGSERGDSGYFESKLEAEEAVRNSDLAWTIMKPSVVYGPGDEFINMLAAQVRRLPVVPVIGDGSYELQPVHVRDVATGFVKALSLPETRGRTYEVGGPQKLSYDRILDEIAAAMGKGQATKIHLPLSVMRPSIEVMQNLPFFPITMDQLTMLLMNNTCDEKSYLSTFAIDPLIFGEAISKYLRPPR
jgi:NADH dehydrogenase